MSVCAWLRMPYLVSSGLTVVQRITSEGSLHGIVRVLVSHLRRRCSSAFAALLIYRLDLSLGLLAGIYLCNLW